MGIEPGLYAAEAVYKANARVGCGSTADLLRYEVESGELSRIGI